MKAFVKDRYGPPDVMRMAELDKPEPTAEQVLVRLDASSVNAYDWHMLRGKPYLARLGEGLRTPKTRVLGLDVAGVVEGVGTNVTHVKPGDRVYGSRSGAFAEYVAGQSMVAMPENLSFEQAAAVPTAGQTALQGLRDHGALESGQRVLVNGAGGGVGSFAVQIAMAMGAEVTAVTNPRSVEVVRSLGAEHVIDYTRDDFTSGGGRYDLIFDAGGRTPLSRMRRALTPTGRIVLVAPAPGDWIGPIVRIVGAKLMSRLGRNHVGSYLATAGRPDLLELTQLIEAGKVTPVLDRTYPFDQTPEAIRHVESGGPSGKVVITF